MNNEEQGPSPPDWNSTLQTSHGEENNNTTDSAQQRNLPSPSFFRSNGSSMLSNSRPHSTNLAGPVTTSPRPSLLGLDLHDSDRERPKARLGPRSNMRDSFFNSSSNAASSGFLGIRPPTLLSSPNASKSSNNQGLNTNVQADSNSNSNPTSNFTGMPMVDFNLKPVREPRPARGEIVDHEFNSTKTTIEKVQQYEKPVEDVQANVVSSNDPSLKSMIDGTLDSLTQVTPSSNIGSRFGHSKINATGNSTAMKRQPQFECNSTSFQVQQGREPLQGKPLLASHFESPELKKKLTSGTLQHANNPPKEELQRPAAGQGLHVPNADTKIFGAPPKIFDLTENVKEMEAFYSAQLQALANCDSMIRNADQSSMELRIAAHLLCARLAASVDPFMDEDIHKLKLKAEEVVSCGYQEELKEKLRSSLLQFETSINNND